MRAGRSSLRVLGWSVLASVTPAALGGCTSRTLEPPDSTPETTFTKRFPINPNRDIDLLFLIDDSGSMAMSQANLQRNFPALMNALENFEGGLPNVHIAVVSSDMGAGDGTFAGCVGTGKGGVFQSRPRGACTATNLQPGATFISNVRGVANYTGALSDVFSCIAALGEGGCGFEHQFAAVTRALGADGQPPPVENHGFLRDDAYLGIIFITNEDDCSAAPGASLFDASANVGLTSELGPPTSFRCNEFGHICDGAKPGRYAPNAAVTDTVNYDNCVSAEGSGRLKTVAETAAQIKALKPDPANQIVVGAITGPAGPYQVHWKHPSVASDSGPWPEVSHSCIAADGSFGDPSVRVTELVQQFGGNGIALSICDAEFAPALRGIASKLAVLLEPPCVVGQIATRPNTTSPDCTVVSHARSKGTAIDQPIPACAETGGAGPCWSLVSGAGTCAGQTVRLTPGPANPPATSPDATVACALCVPGVSAPERGCP